MDPENRVVVLIDMDCFYCQVEEKLDPELKGKPIAVVQYNPWKGGGIIAVNYEARAQGVTRHMRGDEAKEKCPELQLPMVPCFRGKADISKYRDAGKEVARVLQKFTPLLERASIDEAYLDVTAAVQERLKTLNVQTISSNMMPNTYALGYDSIEEYMSDIHNCSNDSIDYDHEHSKWLLVGALIVSEVRAAVYEETGYRCSAGIAHNKILAKLVCGMNKPNKQTILPKHSVNILYKTLSIKKVKHLGGKFGDTVCEILKVSKMCELQQFTEKKLQASFDDKNGTWLYNIARGIDLEPVQAKFNPKSIGCCKQLRGKSALLDIDSLKKWLKDLGDEIEVRLEKDALENNRAPKQMVVSFSIQLSDGRDMSSSRSYNFANDDDLCGDMFASKGLELILESAEGAKVKDDEGNRKLKAPIKFLGISVGKFEDYADCKKTKKIVDYFVSGTLNTTKIKDGINKTDAKDDSDDKKKCNKKEDRSYILNKFFNATNSRQATNVELKEESCKETKVVVNTSPVIQSSLSKQESFFAKYLNGNGNDDSKPIKVIQNETATVDNGLRSTTPICNVINCGEDSNDTEYSGSTIDMEINKSIALFEDDPQDTTRVSNMRELLNSTAIHDDKCDENASHVQEGTINTNNQYSAVPSGSNTDVKSEIRNQDTFVCPECKKVLPIHQVDEHSDYHLALKLREQERERVRNEIKDKRENHKKVKDKNEDKRRSTEEQNKKETVVSIASFFVKFDDARPTELCAECGKRVLLEKFTEHLDFHEAQKLSRELNNKSSLNYSTSSSAKRKRKTVSPVKKTKMPCNSRSIDSFFR